MTTNKIANELNKVIKIKSDIRQAIISKGINVPHETIFEEYSDKISQIKPWGICYYYDKRTINGTNYKLLFYYKDDLTDLSFVSNWDTSKVIDMSYMFQQCENLITIGDLTNWDTSKVTSMGYMFNGCSNLITVGDLTNWDTSEVTELSHMFNGCSNLTYIGDLTNWDTSEVTNMSGMFCGCSNLTYIGDLTNWNVGNCDRFNFKDMFNGCSNLTYIGDLSNWNVGSIDYLDCMFKGCSSLTNLNLKNWVCCPNFVNNMFDGCTSLTELNLSDLDITYCESVGSADDIFKDCISLHTLRLDNCNKTTIKKFITSSNFPTNAIAGKTRTIYCKRENAEGLTPPENWVFNFIDDTTYSYDEETETITTSVNPYTYDSENEQLTYNNPIDYDDDETLTF